MFKMFGGNIMCQKLQEINGLHPKDLREKYCQDCNVPGFYCDSIIELLDRMEITYKPANLKKLEQRLRLKNDTILGLTYSQGDDLKILYSDSLDENEKNYVLGHELGHCCLHLPITTAFHVEMKTKKDYYFLFKNNFISLFKFVNKKAQKEFAADKFAAELLIPTDMFLSFIKSDNNITTRQIAEHFKVTEELAKIKLDLCKKII